MMFVIDWIFWCVSAFVPSIFQIKVPIVVQLKTQVPRPSPYFLHDPCFTDFDIFVLWHVRSKIEGRSIPFYFYPQS